MDKEKTTTPTQEQIESWKKIYGDVFELTVRGKKCYLRKYDRATLAFALSQLTATISTQNNNVEINAEKILKVGEIALRNCWLAGDKEILEDDSLFVPAAMQAGTLFEMEECELKKL
jgi:hypothetical protein